jgi:superfamily I DNA/RNA helicase
MKDIESVMKEKEASTTLHSRVEAYLAILQQKRNKVGCNLEKRWSGESEQCNMYLKLVEKARLGNHSANEYMKDDASVWEIYDCLQRQTGQLDFDSLLILFTESILGDRGISEQFYDSYSHCIVDEFRVSKYSDSFQCLCYH